ncbi:hypothetical protein NP233_g12157 [Leucocoprinus birnbaumii]|uniref:Transmembrane protein n=1 Tax=Leucocoprinus birnbaumii TaxID=56174 RepID=A0AAD5VF73_9AGAR|nr:hypothetical protein NP233_g12157 [Leucocoprinus birnbaumii]
MRTTGSSAVTATDGVPTQASLPISLISTPVLTSSSTDVNDSAFALRLATANMIVRLEQLLQAPWGYVVQPNWLIPLPTTDLNKTSQVDYESDLVMFNYTCRWQVPDAFQGRSITIGNQTWTGPNFTSLNSTEGRQALPTVNGSSVFQMTPTSPAEGFSAFLFLGGNSSLPVNSTDQNRAWIDLSGLPSVFNPWGFVRTRSLYPPLLSPLATLLICDPHLYLTTGTVRLKPTPGLQVNDVTVLSWNDSNRVGNIDDLAAQNLFTNTLTSAINQPDSVPWLRTLNFLNLNGVVSQMLLNVSDVRPLNWTGLGSVPPFELGTINQNLNNFTLSAAKAFTGGDKGEDVTVAQQTTNVSARVVEARSTNATLALATSIQFAILHTVLFVLIAVILAGLANLNRTQGRIPFDLKSIKMEAH